MVESGPSVLQFSITSLAGGETEDIKMPKDDAIEVTGVIKEKFPSGLFSVQLDGQEGRVVLAHLAGKLRTNRIRVLVGDKVTVEMSPYDLTKGRISFRHR
jgi:translation initiation factor IF-1